MQVLGWAENYVIIYYTFIKVHVRVVCVGHYEIYI